MDTPKYAALHTHSVIKILKGNALTGFFTSSPVVAIASNPIRKSYL